MHNNKGGKWIHIFTNVYTGREKTGVKVFLVMKSHEWPNYMPVLKQSLHKRPSSSWLWHMWWYFLAQAWHNLSLGGSGCLQERHVGWQVTGSDSSSAASLPIDRQAAKSAEVSACAGFVRAADGTSLWQSVAVAVAGCRPSDCSSAFAGTLGSSTLGLAMMGVWNNVKRQQSTV